MSKPLTVAIITPYSYQPFRSIWQLCEIFERELTLAGVKAIKVTPPSFAADITRGVPKIHKIVAGLERLLFSPMATRGTLESLRRKAKKEGRDFAVLLSDQSLSPLLFGLSDYATALFVNDCISIRATFGDFALTQQPLQTRISQQMIRQGLFNAKSYVTPTFATAADLRAIVGEDTPVTVAYNPMHSAFYPLSLSALTGRQNILWRKQGVIPRPYFLHVGSAAWYKNRRGVLCLIKKLKTLRNVVPALVFAGEAPTPGELSFIAEHKIEFYSFTNLSDEEIQTLYCGAESLIFPSFVEGFGWPPLEALACGAPVIVTDTAALSELYGTMAAVVLPTPHPEEVPAWGETHACLLNEFLETPAENRQAIIAEGLAYASTFTVERFRAKLMEGLAAAVEKNPT